MEECSILSKKAYGLNISANLTLLLQQHHSLESQFETFLSTSTGHSEGARGMQTRHEIDTGQCKKLVRLNARGGSQAAKKIGKN